MSIPLGPDLLLSVHEKKVDELELLKQGLMASGCEIVQTPDGTGMWVRNVRAEKAEALLNQTSARVFPIQDAPWIPWRLIAPHEAQAQLNHHQSLETLAKRGGLTCAEAVAVLENREWKPMEYKNARARLLGLVGEGRI
jgi:hypothetical protein